MSKSSFVVWRFESILGPGDKPDQQRYLSRVCSLQVSDLTGFMSWAILPLVWLVTEGLDTVLGDLIAWQKNPAAWNYSPFKCTWDLAEPYTGSLHRNLTNSYKKRPDKCGSPRQGVLHQKGRQACSVFLNPGGKKTATPLPGRWKACFLQLEIKQAALMRQDRLEIQTASLWYAVSARLRTGVGVSFAPHKASKKRFSTATDLCHMP